MLVSPKRSHKSPRIRYLLFSVILTIAFRGQLAAWTEPTNNYSEVIPLIQLERVPLTTAIYNLARQAEVNYLIDPKTGFSKTADPSQRKEPLLSMTWTNATARQALADVLARHGLQSVEIAGTTVSKITITNQTAGRVNVEWIKQGTNAAIPLVEMNTIPLDDALFGFAREGQIPIEVSLNPISSTSGLGRTRGPAPAISLRWTSITSRQAIAALCETYDLAITTSAEKDLIRISPRLPATSK